MKTLIKQLLREWLNEAEFNYHVGHSDIPLGDNPKPYGSDNIFRMQGRGTGHFGSGLYFSTFKCDEKTEYDNKYGSNSSNEKPDLIKVATNLYRVDFDIYRNLYRVTSSNHAEILFKTLKLCNETFYSFNAAYEDDNRIPTWLGSRYILLKNNFNKLSLNLPSYKEFIQMLIKASRDYLVRWNRNDVELKNTLRSSFSTRIMVYNGYNGVNVSNIRGYDNTLHGSVIYDMSKIDGEPKPIKNIDYFCKINNRNVAGEMLSGNKLEDLKYKLLSDKDLNDEDFKLINTLDQKTQLMILKRYNKFIHSFFINSMNDYIKSIYFKTLPNKMKSGIIDEIPDDDIIKSIIHNGYVNIIYDPEILIEESTILYYIFTRLWRFDDNTISTILNNIPRQLNPEEQEALKTYHEEWG